MKLEKLPHQRVMCIDGSMRHFEDCVGFCNNCIHKGFVTIKLLQEHKCFEKECIFLDIKSDHPYVIQIQRKKKRKQIINETKKKNKNMEKRIVQFANELLPEPAEIIMCKHLYDSTFILVTHSLRSHGDNSLSQKIYSELKCQVYIKNISERQIQNIECTYLSLLPENMKEKVRKYEESKKRK